MAKKYQWESSARMEKRWGKLFEWCTNGKYFKCSGNR